MAHTPDCPRYNHNPANPACTCGNSKGVLTITVTKTASPICATVKFRDGRKVDLRLNEMTPAGGFYEAEDIESITYYTAFHEHDLILDLGTIEEPT